MDAINGTSFLIGLFYLSLYALYRSRPVLLLALAWLASSLTYILASMDPQFWSTFRQASHLQFAFLLWTFYAALKGKLERPLLIAGFGLLASMAIRPVHHEPRTIEFLVRQQALMLPSALACIFLGVSVMRQDFGKLVGLLRGGEINDPITFQLLMSRAAWNARLCRALLSSGYLGMGLVYGLSPLVVAYFGHITAFGYLSSLGSRWFIFAGLVAWLHLDFQLREDRMSAKAGLEEVGLVAAAVEHDIRTPLSTLGKLLFLMDRESQDVGEVRENVRLAKVQLDRIRAAVDMVPGIQHALENEPGLPCDLGQIAQEALEAVSAEVGLGEAGIEMSVESNLHVLGQPARLMQAITNIVRNAIEAPRNVGEIPVISLRARKEKKSVIVTIRDNGGGISPAIIDKVFEPMVTTKKEDRRQRGLGLYITKRIVSSYGGNVAIESDGKRFTEVSVELPAITTSASCRSPREEPKEESLGEISKTGRGVLILDDDMSLGRSMKKLLQSAEDIRVDQATSTSEAEELLMAHDYNVILVDSNLGVAESGEEWLLRESAKSNAIKIILTGNAEGVRHLEELMRQGIEIVEKGSVGEEQLIKQLQGELDRRPPPIIRAKGRDN